MRRVVLAILLFFLVPCAPGFAGEETKKAKAEELMTLMEVDQAVQRMFSQIQVLLEERYIQQGAPEETRPIFQKYTRRCIELAEKTIGFNALKNEYIAIYVQVFAEEELDGLISFYKSPAGRAMVNKLPIVIQRSTDVVLKHAEEFDAEFQVILEDFEREVQESIENRKRLKGKQAKALGA